MNFVTHVSKTLNITSTIFARYKATNNNRENEKIPIPSIPVKSIKDKSA